MGSVNVREIIIILLVFALVFLPIWTTVKVLEKRSLSAKSILLCLLLTWLAPWLGSILTLILINRESVELER